MVSTMYVDDLALWDARTSAGTVKTKVYWQNTGLILGLRPANERSCNKVTLSLIGWAQT